MPDFDFDEDDDYLCCNDKTEVKTNHVWTTRLAALKSVSLIRSISDNQKPTSPKRSPERWDVTDSTDSLDKSPRIPGRVVTASSELVSLAAR